MPEEFEVRGLKELEEKLLKLDAAVGLKALKNAMAFAATPMLKAAKANVRYSSPDANDLHIRDNLSKQTRAPRRGGATVETRIGVKKMFAIVDGEKKAIAYGHLLEFGGFPFLRPAFDAHVKTFIARFKEKLKKKIDKAVK